jgi:uncharacterized protein (TIGR02757 family)
MQREEIKSFLDEKAEQYNQISFIETDPVSIPHLFTEKEDIEIAGFLTATISWGNRKAILKSARVLMELLDYQPYQFICDASSTDLARLKKFVYRTFNASDAETFILSLRNIYLQHGSLEKAMLTHPHDLKQSLIHFRHLFFEANEPGHASKHLADVSKNASAKRLNMFLRWMVRNDNKGVDFGIWNSIPQASLYLPLDLHTGNVSRKLGLLTRTQNDWKAVEEITGNLRQLDPSDPVKYDFALFGLGIFEHF